MDRLGTSSPEAEQILLKRVSIHPHYRPVPGVHDIAVMILRQAARTKPVAIASQEDLQSADETTVVGFGNDDLESTKGFGIKREVTVPTTSIRRAPEDDLDDDEARFGFDSDLEFVAGGDGKDSCNGDSGGPAYIQVRGSRKLAGLTSRAAGSPTLPCGEGGVYSRVDVALGFIREVAKSAGVSFP